MAEVDTSIYQNVAGQNPLAQLTSGFGALNSMQQNQMLQTELARQQQGLTQDKIKTGTAVNGVLAAGLLPLMKDDATLNDDGAYAKALAKTATDMSEASGGAMSVQQAANFYNKFSGIPAGPQRKKAIQSALAQSYYRQGQFDKAQDMMFGQTVEQNTGPQKILGTRDVTTGGFTPAGSNQQMGAVNLGLSPEAQAGQVTGTVPEIINGKPTGKYLPTATPLGARLQQQGVGGLNQGGLVPVSGQAPQAPQPVQAARQSTPQVPQPQVPVQTPVQQGQMPSVQPVQQAALEQTLNKAAQPAQAPANGLPPNTVVTGTPEASLGFAENLKNNQARAQEYVDQANAAVKLMPSLRGALQVADVAGPNTPAFSKIAGFFKDNGLAKLLDADTDPQAKVQILDKFSSDVTGQNMSNNARNQIESHIQSLSNPNSAEFPQAIRTVLKFLMARAEESKAHADFINPILKDPNATPQDYLTADQEWRDHYDQNAFEMPIANKDEKINILHQYGPKNSPQMKDFLRKVDFLEKNGLIKPEQFGE